MKRNRFQAGFVERQARKRGPDVWLFRYRDAEGDERKKIIGTVKDLPSKGAAQKHADTLRRELTEQRRVTYFGSLIERYRREALPERHGTAGPYLSYLKRIEARWGAVRIEDIDVLEVEQWLAGLVTQPQSSKVTPKPLAKHTLSNIKALMHRVWQCGIRWGVLPADNRIAYVELKRMRRPHAKRRTVLTAGQFLAIAEDPGMPLSVRVMVNFAGRLGLRSSEVLGLRWEDIDLERGTVMVERSVVRGRMEATKTEESEASMPLPRSMVALLEEWRESQPDIAGWVFGSAKTERPLHRENILRRYIAPTAERYGIVEIGWHSFRHTLRATARDADVTDEDQQQLMRHTDLRTTRDYGKDSLQRMRRLREACDRVSSMFDAADKVPPISSKGNTLKTTLHETDEQVTWPGDASLSLNAP